MCRVISFGRKSLNEYQYKSLSMFYMFHLEMVPFEGRFDVVQKELIFFFKCFGIFYPPFAKCDWKLLMFLRRY